MRFLLGLLLIVTAVCANPVLRWQDGAPIVEQQIPVEILEIPEPIVFVAPVQSLSTIESIQEVEEPEPIAISNEIVVPLVDDLRAVIVPEMKKVAQKENALEKNPTPIKKENEVKPKIDKEENKIKAIPEEIKSEEAKKKILEDEQRKDDQLQVETIQDEKFVKNILPAPENLQPVPDVPQEVEGEISSEVKKLTPAEIDANVAPESETEENGLRQDPLPQGLPSSTRPPPPNLLQQFITNPLQSLQNAFSGQTTPATPLEDGATTPQSLLQQGLNTVQAQLQGIQHGLQSGLQGIQSQLTSAFNPPSTQTQQTQSDSLTGEVTTGRPPFNPIQSIQSALSNLLPQGAAAAQDGQQPVSQGPLSGILNLFSPTRAPTTYTPQPTTALLSSSAPVQFDAVTENKEPLREEVSFDSVESSEESGEISVVRETNKEDKKEIENKDEKKEIAKEKDEKKEKDDVKDIAKEKEEKKKDE
ncbi:hypothetical protein ACFFRR_011825 [Megaselia abdita]